MNWYEQIVAPVIANLPLVAVAAWGISVAIKTLNTIARQTTAIERQADAMINAERAWVIAELIPLWTKGEDGFWYGGDRGYITSLTTEDVLRGKHLEYKLVLTNMGRTPAFITKYQVNCVQDAKEDLMTFGLPDRSLKGEGQMEFPEDIINLNKYVGGKHSVVFFVGRVSYRHVFSNTEFIEVPFGYGFDRQAQKLLSIASQEEKKNRASR